MRLAVIADIHGNVLALEAVLADIARRNIDMTIDLGDCVSGPLWPRETFERLARLNLPTARGNHDRALARPPATLGPSDAFARSELSQPPPATAGSWETLALQELTPSACQRLATLPATLTPHPGVIACHGTPTDDTAYLLEDIAHGILIAAPAATITHRLGAATTPLLLCAHSHLPRVISHGRQLIVNPGSVGCPAYIDDTVPAHVSEAGSPHARYAVLDDRSGAWTVDLIAITYDWTRAAERAAQNNRPEWAAALATGRVR